MKNSNVLQAMLSWNLTTSNHAPPCSNSSWKAQINTN